MSQDVDFAVATIRAAGAQVQRTVRPRVRLVRETRATFGGPYDEWAVQRWDAPAWEITVDDRSFVVEDAAMAELGRTLRPRGAGAPAPADGEQMTLGGAA